MIFICLDAILYHNDPLRSTSERVVVTLEKPYVLLRFRIMRKRLFAPGDKITQENYKANSTRGEREVLIIPRCKV